MFIGVDVGTTGVKVMIFDAKGRAFTSTYRTYNLIMDGAGHIECDPDIIWACFEDALQEAVCTVPQKSDIKSICFSSFGEAFVPIDRFGNKLMNSIIATDVRGRDEFEEYYRRTGPKQLETIAGHAKSYDYSISKMLWLKKNRTEKYDTAWKLLLFEDYMGFRLTRETCIDYSLASRTMLLDIRKKIWSKELADKAEIDLKKLAAPVQAGTVIGKVIPRLCEQFGLPPGTVVVAGGHDVPCALLGCGITKPGKSEDTTGTTECISTVIGTKPLSPEAVSKFHLVCEPFVTKGMYNTLAFTWNAGCVLEWYLKNVLKTEQYRGKTTKEMFEEYSALCKKHPRNIFVLPHFSATGTLHMDQPSAGAFVGMTLNTEDTDIYQAIIESITYEMRLNMELLQANGLETSELLAVGGGAKSLAWLQIKANIFERPITTLENSEAGAMGAAILGATALGEYSTCDEAAENMVRIKQTVYPDKKISGLYQERYLIYKDLFRVLQKTHAECRQLT